MSEPIQLEWEPAEWPEKQPKWAGRDRGARVAGISALIRRMAVGDVVRAEIPPTVHPQAIVSRLPNAARSLSARIAIRQIGEHIYVRRVE